MRKLLLLAALVTTAGCEEGPGVTMPVAEAQPSFASVVGEAHRALMRPQSWVDGELFAGVVTPAKFSPASDPFDELYAGGNGFLNDVPLISESKPGDQDYNGGRWHMNVLKEGVDPDKRRRTNDPVRKPRFPAHPGEYAARCRAIEVVVSRGKAETSLDQLSSSTHQLPTRRGTWAVQTAMPAQFTQVEPEGWSA